MAHWEEDELVPIEAGEYLHLDLSTDDPAPLAQAARANAGKIELGRVLDFQYAMAEFAKVCTLGDEKYTRITGEPARYNWRKGFPLSQLMNSTLRHLQAHHSGEDRDPETRCLHVAHAMWNCAAMCEMLIGDSPAGDNSYGKFDDRLEVK